MKDYVFQSHPLSHPSAIITGPNYRFTVLASGLLRYEWAADNRFEDRASTFAVNRNLPVPEFKVRDSGPHELEIITDRFHVSYDKRRFGASGLMASFNDKITQWGAQWRFGEDERGGHAASRNLGGTARTLDEVDGRCGMGLGVLSRFGYAALDDGESMLFDGEGFVCGREPGDRIDGYLFCYGHDYKEAIKTFYAVSGSTPVLPRWALGNWWSRYHPYTQDGYLELMDQFRAREIPLTVAVVDMDWHMVRDKRVSHAGWTGYTWDDRLFPRPEEFGRALHDRKLKITLNDHPHSGIHAFESSYDEIARFLGLSPTDKLPILFDSTNPKFMEAFFSILHRKIERVACDFWWIDWQQGAHSKIPGVDPLWVLNHFHFLDNASVTASKPLIFSRYAGPGSHRYPIGFSGDTITSWASLAFQPEFTATASNVGYGWWSHDIGGHMLGVRDDELVARWVQLGVFSPIVRLHSSDSPWTSKEPWRYRRECTEVMESYLRLRHRLIPYLYTRNVLAARQGEPLVQPMYWSFPDRSEAYAVPNQFFFGPELLVAPIVAPRDPRTNLGRVRAWLPPTLGRHVDIFTGTVYDADRTLNMYRALADYPVLAHEGSIIPLDAAPAPGNGAENPTAFEVLVVLGRDGECTVLEDPADDPDKGSETDGGPETGKERGSLVRYSHAEGRLTARVTGRRWTFRFLAVLARPEGVKVLIDGKDRTEDTSFRVVKYPETMPGLVVDVPEASGGEYTITIEFGPEPELSVVEHRERIKDLLLDYQTPFKVKDQIWAVVGGGGKGGQDGAGGERPISAKVGELASLGLEEELVGPVMELVLADSRGLHV